MTRVRTSIIGGLAAVCLLATALSSLTDTAARATPSVTSTTAAAASAGGAADDEATDVAMLAKSLGLSIEAATIRFGGQSAFTAAVDDFANTQTAEYVTSEWLEDGSGVIYVRPGAAADATASLQEAEALGAVVELDRPSVVEQEAIQVDLIESILTLTASAIDTTIDILADTPTIHVEIAEEPSHARGGESLESQIEALPTETGFRIDAVVDPELVPDFAVEGGDRFGTCTGGFIYNHSTIGGAWGILTARHCPGSLGYDGAQFVSTYYENNSRDLRITRLTNASPYAEFRYRNAPYPSGYRDVEALGEPMSGGGICKYGAVTGWTCTTVRPGLHCSQLPNEPLFCGIYRTWDQNVRKGDSGGPWFWGTTAMGITSGYDDVNFLYDTLTGISIWNFRGGLGYQLRTK